MDDGIWGGDGEVAAAGGACLEGGVTGVLWWGAVGCGAVRLGHGIVWYCMVLLWEWVGFVWCVLLCFVDDVRFDTIYLF